MTSGKKPGALRAEPHPTGFFESSLIGLLLRVKCMSALTSGTRSGMHAQHIHHLVVHRGAHL